MAKIKANLIQYSMNQNYPNPFNPSTTIKYSIPSVIARSGATKQSDGSEIASSISQMTHNNVIYVTLKVYDAIGQEVATLVNEEKSAGRYEVNFDASNLTSGVYFYRLQAGKFAETKKMIFIK